jgi:fatty acid desaturase
MVPARSLGMSGGEVKPLTKAQRQTRQSAIGFFLNLACAAAYIAWSGMDEWSDWAWLVWCVLCMVGCAYFIQYDIKKALRGEDDDAS